MCRQLVLLLGLVFVLGFLIGCASLSDGSGGTYTTTVGTATALDFKTKTPRILSRHQFEIAREEESTDLIYLETYWKSRAPFDDEAEQGIVDARLRLMVNARSRGRGAMRHDMYTVRIDAENMVQYRGEEGWEYEPAGEMLRSYISRIADELKAELDMGVRTF